MPGPGEYRPDPSGHHPHRGLAQAQDPLPEPKLPSSTLSTLRPERLSRSAGATHPPRPGQSPDRSAPRTDCDLFPALLHPLSQVFQCRRDGPGCTR